VILTKQRGYLSVFIYFREVDCYFVTERVILAIGMLFTVVVVEVVNVRDGEDVFHWTCLD